MAIVLCTVFNGTPAASALALAASTAAGVFAVSNSCSKTNTASTTSFADAGAAVFAIATVPTHIERARKRFRNVVDLIILLFLIY